MTMTDNPTAAPPAAGDLYVACAREFLEHARPVDQLPPSVLMRSLAESRRLLGSVLAQLEDSRAFTAGQRATLREALADALAWQERDDHLDCRDCDVHPASLCDEHAERLDRVDAYQALARELMVTP